MKITFWKGVFVADSQPGDKTTLERAGFQQHEPTMCSDQARCKACRAKIGRRYWSSRVEDATKLQSYCTDIALKVMKEHLSRLEKSTGRRCRTSWCQRRRGSNTYRTRKPESPMPSREKTP